MEHRNDFRGDIWCVIEMMLNFFVLGGRVDDFRMMGYIGMMIFRGCDVRYSHDREQVTWMNFSNDWLLTGLSGEELSKVTCNALQSSLNKHREEYFDLEAGVRSRRIVVLECRENSLDYFLGTLFACSVLELSLNGR